MIAPIALTCGDPSGVGPELALAARQVLGSVVPLFWIGDPRHMGSDAFAVIDHPAAANLVPAHLLPVLPHAFASPALPGQPAPENAAGVIEVIERAVALVQSGQASAICTAPIHKKALKDGASFAFPGHTEFLAHLAGVDRVVMMLASPLLRVVPVTIHVALSEVPTLLTADMLEHTIRITDAGLRQDFGVAQPRLAVAGLNPHAGEGGAMGSEEITLITPVLERMRAEGFDLHGPMSADTMFHARARAGYDAAICMYHDQALIPIKTLDFDGGVNVTLGLPFVRTSPDHGTAYDIAGKGIARPDSLIAALKMAHQMAAARLR
ncbi:MAG: 4-hydroxythreonine-4-phosphate dehydrogenase PdxA [Pseudorhodobacter sp. PARRP1]|nr:MAG: 4-hydroxythreonine-4-phosphate dehydrogenase PdxA [Pseudorhodobacter sp. PARRP1]